MPEETWPNLVTWDNGIPVHYHCSIIGEDDSMYELTVLQTQEGFVVEDSWGEVFNYKEIIGQFPTLETAINFAYDTLLKHYGSAQMIMGQIPKEIEDKIRAKFDKK